MTQIERHQEKQLAYRANCGVAVSLLWNPKTGDVSEPISGCLRTERGAEERFVGWLGFVDALKRLNEREEQQ